MNPYRMILELGTNAIVGNLLDNTASKVLDALKPEFQKIARELESIQESLHRQNTMWLRSALTFLSLGQHSNARDELVRAVALDERDVISHFLLGLLLAREGRGELATHHINGAWRKNPFLLLSMTGDHTLEIPTDQELPPGQWTFGKFPGESLVAPFQPSTWWGRFWRSRRNGRVTAASLGSGSLVLLWRLYDVEDADGVTILSSFSPADGSLEWSLKVDVQPLKARDFDLFLAAPAYIVLRSTAQPTDYLFFDGGSGGARGSMRQDSLQAIYCPTMSEVTASAAYHRSHKTFSRIDTVKPQLRQSYNDYLSYYRRNRKRQRLEYSPPKGASESVELTDLLGRRSLRIEVRNDWSYSEKRQSAGPGGSIIVEQCYCTTTIERHE